MEKGKFGFNGSNIIRMSNGNKRMVKNLKIGDCVGCNKKETAIIKSIQKISVNKKCTNLVLFKDGLLIQPHHYISLYGLWIHPYNVHDIECFPCDDLYNIILDDIHTVYINNVVCITYGRVRIGALVALPICASMAACPVGITSRSQVGIPSEASNWPPSNRMFLQNRSAESISLKPKWINLNLICS